MTPERLAEIRATDARASAHPGDFTDAGHRRELLAYVDELKANRDGWRRAFREVRAERNSAHRSILTNAQSLASLAAFELTRDPDSAAWNIVNASAQALLAAGGVSLVGDWQPTDADGSEP